MSAQPKLNISSIIGIKEGIHQVFSLIDQNLEDFSKHPANLNPIKDCRNYIYQLDGLLKMLELTSITIVSEKIGQLIDALIEKKIEPNEQILTALKQSPKALLYYLDELIDGVEDNPLRLYPTYRGLMQVYGFENAPESDLFFPQLTATPTLKAEAANIDPVLVKILSKKIGGEYQAGLLKWLRDPANRDGLLQMVAAVSQLEAFPGTMEQRAFWWVTAGFLEALLPQEANRIDVSIRRLCGKIEQAIRHLAAGTLSSTSVLMRELLYYLAHSEASSERVKDIKRSYTWPNQAVASATVTFEESETLRPVLDTIRSTLMQANDIWREFCAGQQESVALLFEKIEQLKQLAKQTPCVPLGKLIDVISETVTYLRAHPQSLSEELAMEMATALLLIESIVDDFNKLSPDLPNQIDILSSRLHSVTEDNENATELPCAPNLNEIASKTQEKELVTHVVQEMLTNLSQIESILDRFFFEPAERSELSTLSLLFKQVSGALVMLDLQRANTLLNLCQHLAEKLLEPGHEIEEAEQILLVDGLSSLGFYIEGYRSGQPDGQQIIDEAIMLFEISATPEKTPQSTQATTPQAGKAAQVEVVETDIASIGIASAQPSGHIDHELLAIFLEEAEEVLIGIANDAQKCQIDPFDHESLTSLRRGFHTLKGSGRMVKLTEMGEVAWGLEQVLNRCLNEKRPVTDPIIRLITRTCQDYSQWCQQLREQGTARVNADELMRLAKDLLNDKDIEISLTDSTAAGSDQITPITIDTALAPEATETTRLDFSPTETETAQPLQQAVSAVVDSVSHEVLPVFLEETQDIIPQIGSKLRAWRILPQDDDIHRALLRLLHTLKGSARMVGAMQLGELVHAMESHVETAFSERNITDAALDQLENEFDVISGKIEQLQAAEAVSAAIQQTTAVSPAADAAAASDKTELLQSKTILRINSDLIDRLVNDAGEASIQRSKIEAQLNSFKQSLQDLAESTHRLHDQLREVEIQAETQMQSHLAQQQEAEQTFDPLEFDRFSRFQELTRLMAESVDDIISVQKSMRATHTAAEEAVNQQSVINRQLQQSLLQIRTIPFSNYGERYYRIARQVAEDLGKKANLDIQGGDVEIDRSVLEKINPPLEHLLRNAIAHGIEEPAQRLQAGKPETGQITIQLRQEGNEVNITLSDDGRGLNLSRIREEAQRLGLIQGDETLEDDKIMSLIFMQGLSTTDSITGIAGRGIGLDIVKNEISMLGGRIHVNSVPNQGTTFNIYLPLSLAVTQTMMVRAAKQTYAIPTFIVEHQREFDPEMLKKIYQDHRIEFNGKKYLFAHLSHLLGELDHVPDITKHSHVLFLHSGTQYLAIHIDELIGDTEVVVKNIDSQLAHAPGVEGVTIMGDGEVILILNPVKLIQRADAQKIFSTPASELGATPAKRSITAPTVMVVDDSLTVRKVTCRLLEREGCDVLIAKNGVEAVQILKDNIPDAMLVDLEMPKMNGFELIKQVRANPITKKIPIIIISSRTADKHRKIAKDLGVNIFLGKPYKEDELLKHLSELINR